MTLAEDPRWQRFNNSAQPCPCCGRTFDGVFDIGFDHPEGWPHGNRAESGQDVLAVGKDSLSADLCRMGAHRFIRCVLYIPIIGTDQKFAFGPWGAVNAENFDTYVRNELSGTLDQFEGCFAWMMNLLPGFEMNDWLPCNLVMEDLQSRPVLEVHDGAHELAQLQEDGISFDRLLDIYADAGQDIRPHLEAPVS